ncbi:hypothetical protein LHYA1_G002050 [Lachnellula hyalina]|uniref:DUF7892 domain-containing protein n=1 Tax=Lachnellula hyalina TaxID=1316788 RepID=A0A8H8U2Z5_9HELO|nr:uncharacterized protein LHYA1_G002050 [Lachnellula hyalina]TVY29786.1 hypothetical protein LHYA1_G002050 [Lachnellula hyalina]
MDSPGSVISLDSEDSSTADPTTAGSHPTQAPPSLGGNVMSGNMDTTIVSDDDDSSDSDVSMSADTDDEDEQGLDSTTAQGATDANNSKPSAPVPSTNLTTEGSRKRKYSSSTQEATNGHVYSGVDEYVRKRLKPDEAFQRFRSPEGNLLNDRSLLPAEIWHHIFTFCPPRALGSLLQVNKSFNAFLEPSKDVSIDALPGSATKVLNSDTIWKSSRLLFRHGMPGPLAGTSELDMWRLACGPSCQFCNKKQAKSTVPGDQWHPGPGESGVVPVWSFGIRACGSCLEQNSTKIAKRYSNSHIEDIKQEFDNVKALGSATAEEWLKGLDERGKERKSDAARWERYESMGGVTNMRKVHHETPKPEGQNSNLIAAGIAKPIFHATNGNNKGFPLQPTNPGQQTRPFPNFQPPGTSQPAHTVFPTAPGRFESPSQNGFNQYPLPRQHPQARPERTKEEVTQLKAARRAEIERRCMMLEPPLTAGVLAHMSSFQAAIQIIQPLNDGAWDVLKPRLLSQREEAEQRENDRLAQTRVVQERFDERRYQDVQINPEAKDSLDREWDDIQAPLRVRIGGYADEIIRDGWNGGEKVNYENCPKFAADVLIYVRKRFYAEISKDEAAVRATGREPEIDPLHGPYLRKLVLENMKWVFDTKVKPHTEHHRKELFLCNACDSHLKFYGFEGVIQHYAAKHTSSLSLGSVVVHWKSEWPEIPPFNPDPTAVINGSYYAAAPSASAPYASTGPASAPQQNYGYGGYQSAPVSVPIQAPMPAPMQPPMQAPMPVHNSRVYQESPGPYYGHPQFGDQFSGHQNGPYQPPQAYQDTSQGYQNPQYTMPPPPPGNVGYSDAPQDYSQQGYGGVYPASSPGMYSSNQGQYPASAPEISVHQHAHDPQVNQYGPSYNQQPSYPASSYVQEAPKTEEWKMQLQAIAKTAREVWNTINPVKEIPGNVKVYTIIYHILQRSRASYPEDPPLPMVIEGLNHNKEMRPARNINGLLCKACALGQAGYTPALQKKHFSFPQLLNHFREAHEAAPQNLRNEMGYFPDWTKDMVQLPDISKLTSLSKSSDHRLKLVKEALPEVFAPPVTHGTDARNGPSHQDYAMADQNTHGNLAPSQDNHDKYYTTTSDNKTHDFANVSYDNGEYDPRNPHELPLDSRPVYKSARQLSHPREFEIPDDRTYGYTSRDEEHRQPLYQYVEQRHVSPPSHIRAAGDYERVIIREEAPVYVDRRPRYLDAGEIEYRVRRDPLPRYEDREPVFLGRDPRHVNSESYEANREDHQTLVARDPHARDEDATAQQNTISQVVAQISQHAQQARDRLPPKEPPTEVGSEDGEVRPEPDPQSEIHPSRPEEANDAAERFLNDFRPSGTKVAASKPERHQGDNPRAIWEPPRNEEARYIQDPAESRRRVHDSYDKVGGNFASEGHPANRIVDDAGYVVIERQPPRQARAFAYDDRFANPLSEQSVQRERSPELVDRRYKLNNVVYRDERQSSHGAHRTPSRYARYESVRLENDRARSRSPVYVKTGGQPGQYREHSPAAHSLHPEPIYHPRTPQPATEDVPYERAPRQEYQRVYADDPRPRAPQYAETYELVRVTDSQGEYMLRRPVRREPQPVYAAYEDDGYARQPVYESRAPIPRPEPAFYEEEYDPRHPQALQPPPAVPVHQASRYQ